MDFLSPLPPAGEDAAEYLPDKQLFLRHGSSLAVISQVSKVLNDSKVYHPPYQGVSILLFSLFMN